MGKRNLVERLDAAGRVGHAGVPVSDVTERSNPYVVHSPMSDGASKLAGDGVVVLNPVAETSSAVYPPDVGVNLRYWTVVLVLAASLFTFVSASLVMTLVAFLAVHGFGGVQQIGDAEALQAMTLQVTRSRIGFPLMVMVPQFALIVPCLAAAYLSPIKFRKRLGLVRGGWPKWAWVSAMLATPLVGMLSAAIGSLMMEESEHLKEIGGIFREHAESGFLVPLALMIGIVPALCEELLFRGYVQTRLTAVLGKNFLPSGGGAMLGVLIASVVFAVFHWDFVHVVTVFPIGLFLGWVSYRSGSLVPAMMGHFLNNAMSVFIMVLAPEDSGEIQSGASVWIALAMLGFGALGALGTLSASVFYDAGGLTSWATRLIVGPDNPNESAPTPDAIDPDAVLPNGPAWKENA
ncbi:MAG: CPBP family intramembrane glutamic endopeptidase [Planctomycetota bacterium]